MSILWGLNLLHLPQHGRHHICYSGAILQRIGNMAMLHDPLLMVVTALNVHLGDGNLVVWELEYLLLLELTSYDA